MSQSTIAPQNAAEKLSTVKPLTTFETSKIIRALIIKIKNPNVRIVIGNVNKIKIGRTKMLAIPRSAAATMAAKSVST